MAPIAGTVSIPQIFEKQYFSTKLSGVYKPNKNICNFTIPTAFNTIKYGEINDCRTCNTIIQNKQTTEYSNDSPIHRENKGFDIKSRSIEPTTVIDVIDTDILLVFFRTQS